MSRFLRHIFRIRETQSETETPTTTTGTANQTSNATAITQYQLPEAPSIAPNAASHVRLINPTTVAKTGDGIRMTEATSMRYVRSRTSIPVPEVIDTFVHPETKGVCILIDGTQKEHVKSQIKGVLEELRQIKGTFIGSVRAMPEHDIVFTHNDLAPRNILVRDGNVVAILDWVSSGFYPSYWEYVKAWCWPDWQSGWIKDNVIDRILDPYLTELAFILHARDLVW
ncbi:MAG: hypothetical protein Q9204_002692 [Flavoplaca sp. TL-2023a]